jgi:hypothetical protein
MNMEWRREMARACSPAKSCRGRLAASAKRFPLLPLDEEGRLNDMPLRENFIERVFAYYRWTEMLAEYRTGSPPRTASPLGTPGMGDS